MEKKNEKQFNIEITEEIAEGKYSNLAIISHSESDFVLDFVNVVPNAPKAKVKSRIIVTPENAKRLSNALIDNINKYEEAHGKIKSHEKVIAINFGAPTAQA